MAQMTQAVQDKAFAINQRRADSVNSALSDPMLSNEGKRIAVAKAQLTAHQQMADLKNQFEGGAVTQQADLARSLFGASNVSGADAISLRDAQDRASQIADADEASQLMDSALLSGDSVLAKAVAAKAVTEGSGPQAMFGAAGWDAVINKYVDAFPNSAGPMQQFIDARRTSNQQAQDALTNAMTFHVPTEPSAPALNSAAACSAFLAAHNQAAS